MNTYIRILLVTFVTGFILSKNGNGQPISFLHKDVTIDSVSDASLNWQELKEPIYNGFDNGVYWFKIELDSSSNDRMLSIPESHVSRANLYLGNKEVRKKEKERYVTYKIKAHTKKRLYYLRVNCLLEARIPVEITDIEAYHSNEIKAYVIMALYYGLVLAILIFNLFSYVNLQNKTYLYYMLVCIGMVMTPFYKDGLSAMFFGLTGINEVLESIISGIVAIGGVYFTARYFRMHKEMPRSWKTAICTIIFAYVCSAIFIVTRNEYFFAASHIVLIVALDIFVISAALLWEKSVYARIFVMAYGVPLLLGHEAFISPYFAIPMMNSSSNAFKVGSVFEMIIFTYAIAYQAKQLAEENRTMRHQLIEYSKGLSKIKNPEYRKITLLKVLTVKETEIFTKLAEGKLNKEIADELFVSINSVKHHIKNIYAKLEVSNKKHVIRKFTGVFKELEQ